MDHFHARNELGIDHFDKSCKDGYINNKIYDEKPDNSFFNYFPILRGKIFGIDGQYLSICDAEDAEPLTIEEIKKLGGFLS